MDGVIISIKDVNMFEDIYIKNKEKIIESILKKILKEYIKDK